MDFLKRIQSKPDHVKAYYSFGFASLITGLVALVWVSALPARFSDTNTDEVARQENGQDTLLTTAKEQFANVIGGVEGATEVINEPSALESLGGQDSGMGSGVGGGDFNNGEAPQVTTTEAETASEGEPEAPPAKPTSQKTILIETKPSETPRESPAPRTILIGTSTVQKTE